MGSLGYVMADRANMHTTPVTRENPTYKNRLSFRHSRSSRLRISPLQNWLASVRFGLARGWQPSAATFQRHTAQVRDFDLQKMNRLERHLTPTKFHQFSNSHSVTVQIPGSVSHSGSEYLSIGLTAGSPTFPSSFQVIQSTYLIAYQMVTGSVLGA